MPGPNGGGQGRNGTRRREACAESLRDERDDVAGPTADRRRDPRLCEGAGDGASEARESGGWRPDGERRGTSERGRATTAAHEEESEAEECRPLPAGVGEDTDHGAGVFPEAAAVGTRNTTNNVANIFSERESDVKMRSCDFVRGLGTPRPGGHPALSR